MRLRGAVSPLGAPVPTTDSVHRHLGQRPSGMESQGNKVKTRSQTYPAMEKVVEFIGRKWMLLDRVIAQILVVWPCR